MRAAAQSANGSQRCDALAAEVLALIMSDSDTATPTRRNGCGRLSGSATTPRVTRPVYAPFLQTRSTEHSVKRAAKKFCVPMALQGRTHTAARRSFRLLRVDASQNKRKTPEGQPCECECWVSERARTQSARQRSSQARSADARVLLGLCLRLGAVLGNLW